MKSNDLKLSSILKQMNEEVRSDAPKVAMFMVNALSGLNIDLKTSDEFLRDKARQLNDLRIEIMEYIEKNSNYTWYGKSPSGFKLVKKKK